MKKKIYFLIFILLLILSGCGNKFELVKQKERCRELGEMARRDRENDIWQTIEDQYAYNEKMKTCLWFHSATRVDRDHEYRDDLFIMDLYTNKVLFYSRSVNGEVFQGPEIEEFDKVKKELFDES